MAASPGWPAESGRVPRRGSRSPDPFHHNCCARSTRRYGEEPVSELLELSPRRSQPTVLKFGGTSVADVDALQRVARLVRRVHQSTRTVVIVSALAGVTDALLTAVDAAANGAGDPKRPRPELDALIERHQGIATRLASPQAATGIGIALTRARIEIAELLHAIAQEPERRPALRDEIAAYGERLSA